MLSNGLHFNFYKFIHFLLNHLFQQFLRLGVLHDGVGVYCLFGGVLVHYLLLVFLFQAFVVLGLVVPLKVQVAVVKQRVAVFVEIEDVNFFAIGGHFLFEVGIVKIGLFFVDFEGIFHFLIDKKLNLADLLFFLFMVGLLIQGILLL